MRDCQDPVGMSVVDDLDYVIDARGPAHCGQHCSLSPGLRLYVKVERGSCTVSSMNAFRHFALDGGWFRPRCFKFLP